jgi:hypothetical protein
MEIRGGLLAPPLTNKVPKQLSATKQNQLVMHVAVSCRQTTMSSNQLTVSSRFTVSPFRRTGVLHAPNAGQRRSSGDV